MAIPKTKTKRESDYLKKTFTIYGVPKIGKSTLVSRMGDDKNKILFFATEAGHKELEIYKWQKEIKQEDGSVKLEDPTTWEDFKKCVIEMTQQDEFRCLAIDTIDNLFHWCSKHIYKKKGIEHASDLGFGKGYEAIKDEFHSAINYLTQKGYGVFFLSHSKTQDKELGNKKITYTDSTLSGTASKVVHGISDYILYLYADLDGNRVIKTKGDETINAGDRSGRLPELLPLDAELLKQELMKQE